MIYVITGAPRSGTTMLMAALEAGGLPVAKSTLRDKRMAEPNSDEHYKVNPQGLYELSVPEMRASTFPKKHEGCAVKIVFPWLQWMRPVMRRVSAIPLYAPGYRVLLIVRHPEEVRQSYEGAFQKERHRNAKQWPRVYGAQVKGCIAAMCERPDVLDMMILKYPLKDPVRIFQRLADAGWPIDAGRAASTVNPELYRFRLDKLVVGI